jgi:hypothetical protein
MLGSALEALLGERLSASIEKAAAIEPQTFNASSNLSRAVHRSTAKTVSREAQLGRLIGL